MNPGLIIGNLKPINFTDRYCLRGSGYSKPSIASRMLLTVAICIASAAFARAVESGGGSNPSLNTAVTEAMKPVGLFLQWQRDPTTTMTIDWHTTDGQINPKLEYQALDSEQWHQAQSTSIGFPYSDDRVIHRVELTGLEPATKYRFRMPGVDQPYKFRTMPDNANEPIRFITGGDTSTGDEFRKTNQAAALYDPEFIAWGGDLAYANGDPRRIYRWYSWFEDIMETLITPSNRVIPVLVTIGNHEVFRLSRLDRENGNDTTWPMRKWGLEDGRATFFETFFAMPGLKGWGLLDFGDYMSIFLLDTDHGKGSTVAGEPQTVWLEKTLKERRHIPHLFPVYHVPAYSSVRGIDGAGKERIRENWVPLFEENGVRVVFENHDHAYKRTYPMKNERISPNGIVFMGDGAWGVGPRDIASRQDENDRERWYEEGADWPWFLNRAEAVRHFILVTIQGTHQHFIMIDNDNNIIDEYPATIRP